MRTILGITITITLFVLAYIVRKPALKWAFNHKNDQPETPHDWAPRYRTWKNGTEQ